MQRLTTALLIIGAVIAMAGSVQAEEAKTTDEIRDPAATDQVFTPEYLDQVNAEKQAANAERKRDSERHQKMLDFYTRQR